MNNLPQTDITEPEYLAWPLEKLQHEYWTLNLKYHAQRLSQIDRDHKAEDVDSFIAALKRLMEE